MDSFLGKRDHGSVGERYSASMRERHGRACAGVVLCCGHLRFSCGAGGVAIDMFGATVLLALMATTIELFAGLMALLSKRSEDRGRKYLP